MTRQIPVRCHDFCRAPGRAFSCSSSSSLAALRNSIHHHLTTSPAFFLRTGVTLSPHLSLCAPPLHPPTRVAGLIPPAHKEGLEAPHRLKGHTGTGRCNHGARRKSPRYCQSPRCARMPRTMLLLARAHTNRFSNIFLNSASTSATSRAMVRFHELSRYGFRISTSPALAPSRTTGHAGAACPGNVDVDMAGLTSLIPSPISAHHRRLVSV